MNDQPNNPQTSLNISSAFVSRYEARLSKLNDRIEKLNIAMRDFIEISREFCHRVEIGEVRSQRTYEKMKAALKIVDQET